MNEIRIAALALFSIASEILHYSEPLRDLPPTAEYLVDGVEKLYIVDASRCSSVVAPSGETYLIDSPAKLERVRDGLSRMDPAHGGVCGCGGPEIWLYGVHKHEGVRWFGLDCEHLLDHIDMTGEVLSLLHPNRKGFLGIKVGYATAIKVPVDVTREDLLERAHAANYLVLTEIGPRERELERRFRERVPALITLTTATRWPFEPVWLSADTRLLHELVSEAQRAAIREAIERFDAWIERHQLREHLLEPITVKGGAAYQDEDVYFRTFEVTITLDDPAVLSSAIESEPIAEARTLMKAEHVGMLAQRSIRLGAKPAPTLGYSYLALVITPKPLSPEQIPPMQRALPMVDPPHAICTVGYWRN